MSTEQPFDEIMPYNDQQTSEALLRLTKEPFFFRIMKYFFPEKSKDEIISEISRLTTVKEWQVTFMHPIVYHIIDNTSDGLTYSGFDQLNDNTHYLFISNHRDILLDSAILQVLLYDNGLETSQITFGNNLMESQFITDAGKINKMFTVARGTGGKEFYENSNLLSNYIRSTIKEKDSIWIAQRNGRTKDGDDKTQVGLLKMLNISGNNGFVENFSELNIVPMSISYEYEPCDYSKVSELFLSGKTEYVKKRGEDIESLVNGIVGKKGRIHLSITEPITDRLLTLNEISNENEKIKILTGLIDEQIHKNYKLWPTNYIAYDLFFGNNKYKDFYEEAEKQAFLNYIKPMIIRMEGEEDLIRQLFLKLYANPVINVESYQATK